MSECQISEINRLILYRIKTFNILLTLIPFTAPTSIPATDIVIKINKTPHFILLPSNLGES